MHDDGVIIFFPAQAVMVQCIWFLLHLPQHCPNMAAGDFTCFLRLADDNEGAEVAYIGEEPNKSGSVELDGEA